MRAVSRRLVTAALAVGLVATAHSAALAQAKQPAPANPVGAGWAGTVTPAPGASGDTYDDKQVAAVQAVNGYFNALTNLKGRFAQTDADGKVLKGLFYVKRPGRFRFDYARPSRKIIISDGKYLAIQDHDLGNEDIYELDNTPFRLLLRKDVDLLRDARIIEVADGPDAITLTMQDKSPDAPGRIRIVLARGESLSLKEWVTTDAQGLNTRVEVSELNTSEELDAKLFQKESLVQRNLR